MSLEVGGERTLWYYDNAKYDKVAIIGSGHMTSLYKLGGFKGGSGAWRNPTISYASAIKQQLLGQGCREDDVGLAVRAVRSATEVLTTGL